ncbi:MAG: DUF3047 domain-containing protein [Burkholderiales bacterium]
MKIFTLLLALAWLQPVWGWGADTIKIGEFSAQVAGGTLPAEWKLMPLGNKKLTRFTLVENEGKTVVRAESNHAVAALLREVRVDAKRHALLRWRWKVENLLQKSDIHTKQGDDYPARLYVIFDYDIARLPWPERLKLKLARVIYGERLPAIALCYVWDSRAPQGTLVDNAFTRLTKMLVVESGGAKLGLWVDEERNIFEDYRTAFGEDPPPLSGIAIAVDTDNTGERALSYFGDITLAAP